MTTREKQAHEPLVLCAATDGAAIADLRRSAEVFDTIRAQLGELVETRCPSRKMRAEEVASEVDRLIGSDPDEYGSWVHFPWSSRLVHILPRGEYFELRTSRNRNKITAAEQEALSKLTLGVAGLSVGQATAVTLALEGIGGTMRLADFDTLSLSNMNRLRAGVHEIGVNKTLITAHAIFEINPYARIELFTDGITDANIDRFLDSLDLLFEECDDLKMKFRLRHEARRRKIPVLMETSDRGMLDVERFDREPDRALFHGLVAEVDPDRLTGMTTYEKVPIVLDIIGAETMSRRMAASLVDIEATIKTWPQLASAVSLGGAINTDVARRVALGSMTRSGRFYVDVESVVPDDPRPTAVEAQRPPRTTAPPSSGAAAPEAPVRLGPGEPVRGEVLERLVRGAALAPSGGNCQPWRFTYGCGVLRCWHDEERSRSFLDFEHRATHLAFGALAENLRLVGGLAEVGVEVRPLPDPARPRLVVEATLGGRAEALSPEDAGIARLVEVRTTNRKLGARVALPPGAQGALEDVATRAGATLRLITDPSALAAIGDLLGEGDRLRLMSKIMHREMMGEIRWSEAEARASLDGLDVATLELTATDRAAMRLVSSWSVMAALRTVGGGEGLASPARKSIASASAVGLLTVPRAAADARERALSYLRGGIALQRVWLHATRLGLAFQPMTAIVYLFARLGDGGGAGLEPDEAGSLAGLRRRYESLLGLPESVSEIMLFRLAVAGPPTARSLRRRVGDLLRVDTEQT
jgi:molybdopterin/thiamine biosynthesis adenylyltransferase/nitroreductase